MVRAKRTSKRPILFLIMLLVILVAFYFFLHSSLFLIDHISIVGNKVVSKQDILNMSGIETGKNIFDIDTQASARAIQIIPRIKEVKVTRHLPKDVKIEVLERQPFALIVYQDGFLVIDDQGVCLEKTDNCGMANQPIITLEDISPRITEGQKVNPQSIKTIREIMSALPPLLSEQIAEYHCSKEGQVLIYTLRGTEVRFGGLERLEEKVGLFEQVMKISEKAKTNQFIQYVDLRYTGQPVISYKRK